MDNRLFTSFREEIFDQAKRLVPIVYDDSDFLSCDLNKLKK